MIGVVLALSTLIPAGATANRGSSEVCAKPEYVLGVGLACKTPGGYVAKLPDGHVIQTHGPDLAPTGAKAYVQANDLTSKPLAPSCATNPANQFHLHAIYAYPASKPSRYRTMRPEIQKMLMEANGQLDDEANKWGLKMSYRMLCQGGAIQVDEVPIPTGTVPEAFLEVVIRTRAAGYNNPLAKYMIWMDRRIESKSYVLGGTADLIPDDHLASNNYNNFGARYTVVFGRRINDLILPGGIVFMHEAGHNFGLVSPNSPRGTGSHHCNDGIDVMCYGDTSSNSNYTDRSCKVVTYDCGHNDYFNPRPSKSNYLSTHWNFASPLNRFVAGCQYRTGVLAAPLPSAARDNADVVTALNGTATTSFSISKSCWGRPYAISGVVVPPPKETHLPLDAALYGAGTAGASQGRVEAQLLLRPESDFNICFYKSKTLIRCAEAVGTDKGSIPTNATSARVFLNAGANSIWVFNSI